MYSSFQVLAVSNDAELRDPNRIRKIFRHYYRGTQWGSALLGFFGLLFMGGFTVLAWCIYTRRVPNDTEVYSGLAFLFFCGVMLGGLGAAFYNEARSSPLAGYPREPEHYDFAPAELTKAWFPYDDSHSNRRARVTGRFGERGLFIVEFKAAVWSRNVAEKGEEHLKEGDDWYEFKGKRARMPLKAWAIYRRDRPARAELAGLPRELTERLKS